MDIPGVDLEALERACRDHNSEVLERARAMVYEEEATAEEKLRLLEELFEEEEA